MFKFWRRKPSELTIRAEDLKVGDRFVYEVPVRVDQIHKTGKKDPHKMHIRLEVIQPEEEAWPYRAVGIYRELFITVTR